jgi:hypothetical protein
MHRKFRKKLYVRAGESRSSAIQRTNSTNPDVPKSWKMAVVLRLIGGTGQLITGKLTVRRDGSHSTGGSKSLNRYSSSIPSDGRELSLLYHMPNFGGKLKAQHQSKCGYFDKIVDHDTCPRASNPRLPSARHRRSSLHLAFRSLLTSRGEVGRPGSQDCAPCSCVDSLACSSRHPPTSVLLPLDHQPLPSLSMLSDWVMSTRATKATSWHMATSPYGSSQFAGASADRGLTMTSLYPP